jgi:hypothetical protein
MRGIVGRSSEQLSCPIMGETAILNLTNGTYFGLDPVGTRIWELIATPSRFTEIHSALVREFEVTPQKAEEDLHNFLSELAGAGLLEVRE